MAITDKTRRIIAGHRAQLQQKIDANLADIKAHEEAIAKIEVRNVALIADFDTLKKDIPEPPVEPASQ